MKYPSAIAVIPARGGSKGIPGKNLVSLGGKPLVVHAIEAALGSRTVGQVVVSTDDRAIAAVAATAGARVVMRPPDLATDEASSESVLLHVLDELKHEVGKDPDILVFLQCTSPFTISEDIDGVLDALVEANADSAFTAARFHGFLWKRDADGAAVAVNHDASTRLRRQDLEPEFLETGAVYAMRVDGFRRAAHRFFGRTVLYEVPAGRAVELDEPADLVIASALAEYKAAAERSAKLPAKLAALVMDFDGVFTDNKVVVSQDGTEAVICDRSDGWGIGQLRRRGLPMLVLSTEANPVVQARCRKLSLECINGVKDKLPVLKEWCERNDIPMDGVVYVGNDVNDSECLEAVGCGIVVADAHPETIGLAQIVLKSNGGRGAVREVTDMVLAHLLSTTPSKPKES